MTRPSQVDKLPAAVRAEVTHRLLSAGFGNYASTAAWLKEQGFTVSKSGLHRFGQQLKERHGDHQAEDIEQARALHVRLPELRMRCIEAASRGQNSDVLAVAEGYLRWVLRGQE